MARNFADLGERFLWSFKVCPLDRHYPILPRQYSVYQLCRQELPRRNRGLRRAEAPVGKGYSVNSSVLGSNSVMLRRLVSVTRSCLSFVGVIAIRVAPKVGGDRA